MRVSQVELLEAESLETTPISSVPAVDSSARGVVYCIVFAIAATLAVVFLAARLELIFLEKHGHFFDPAAYYMADILVYKSLVTEGLWTAVVKEIVDNGRCPGRTIPLLLFAPKLLINPLGHLATEVPLLLSFVTLFAYSVYIRTRSVLLPLSLTCLFLSLPCLLSPEMGIGAYWLDLTSACALGCVTLCLLRFVDTSRWRWIILAGVFVSATALCRWSASFYLISFLALAIPLVAINTHVKNRGSSLVALVLGGISALPGVVFAAWFSVHNLGYYKVQGYAFGAPVWQSVSWTGSALVKMIGLPVLFVLALSVVMHLFASFKKRANCFSLLCAWLPVSIFLFVCVLVKAINGYHPLMYFVPALFIAAFCPFGITSRYQKWCNFASAAIMLFAAITLIHSYDYNRRLAANPAPSVQKKRLADLQLANLIVSVDAGTFAKLDMESVVPQLDVVYNYGRLSQWRTYFSLHECDMKVLYPAQTPEQMGQTLFDTIKKEVCLVTVFDDPNVPLVQGMFTNRYTATVCSSVARRVAGDSDFKLVGTTQSPRGIYATYKNLKLRNVPLLRF